MVTLEWIDRQMAFLSSWLGVYRLNAGDKFFFDPNPGFYGFISQGNTKALNEAMSLIQYNGPNHSRIQIGITNKHSPFVLGGILAHELTHHFLMTKGIGISNVDENERLTDLATVYIGLGNLTLNGYEELEWTIKRGSEKFIYTYKVISNAILPKPKVVPLPTAVNSAA